MPTLRMPSVSRNMHSAECPEAFGTLPSRNGPTGHHFAGKLHSAGVRERLPDCLIRNWYLAHYLVSETL